MFSGLTGYGLGLRKGVYCGKARGFVHQQWVTVLNPVHNTITITLSSHDLWVPVPCSATATRPAFSTGSTPLQQPLCTRMKNITLFIRITGLQRQLTGRRVRKGDNLDRKGRNFWPASRYFVDHKTPTFSGCVIMGCGWCALARS